MKFVSLIASTLLIVLISQHSSTALPINDSATEEPCLEGFERVDGRCVEIKSELHSDQVESSSPLVESVTLFNEKARLQSDKPERFGACPKGMVRSDNGICEEVMSHDQPAVTIEPKEGHDEPLEITDEPSHVTVVPLDAASERLEVTEEPFDVTHEPLEVTEKLSKVNRKPLEVTEEPLDVTIEPSEVTEEPLDVTGEPLKVNEKLSKINRKPLEVTQEPSDVTGEPLEVTEEPSDVTGEPLEVTSEKSDVDDDEEGKDGIRKSGPVEVPKGCPQGTKADEDGACQDIKQTSTKKTVTDLKVLLNKDGSCPENMKKINGRCMYLRSKAMAKINQNFATINGDDLAASRTHVASDKNEGDHLVAVLPDNSCPDGTEYSEYGLCRKRIRPSSLSALHVAKTECPKDQVFVGGRCIFKKVEVLLPSDVTTKVSKSSTTAPETEQSEVDESPRSTTKRTIIKDTTVEA